MWLYFISLKSVSYLKPLQNENYKNLQLHQNKEGSIPRLQGITTQLKNQEWILLSVQHQNWLIQVIVYIKIQAGYNKLYLWWSIN